MLIITGLLLISQVPLLLVLQGTNSFPYLFTGIKEPFLSVLNAVAGIAVWCPPVAAVAGSPWIFGAEVVGSVELGLVGEDVLGIVAEGLVGSEAQLIFVMASSVANVAIFVKCNNFMLTPRWLFLLGIR
ncbi:MAG TPA: hypothetical protein VIZ65_09630 [Cellvibrionaceae bacterium]